jgi:hypothetical protein
MDDTAADKPCPIDDLLQPASSPAGDDALRPALLLRTTAILRRRRRLRQAAVVAALGTCYVAGILTMRLWTPAARPAGDPGIASRRGSEEKKRAAPRHPAVPNTKKPDPSEKPESPLALEWRAIDCPERRAELYRRAGNGYLEANDVASALRCYRGALAASAEKEWVISIDDNWLLMVAKQEKLKEKRDASNGG